MPDSEIGHVRLVRVTCFLPMKSPEQEDAVKAVLRHIEAEKIAGVRGYTHSDLHPTVFNGFWHVPGSHFQVDAIVLCIIDLDEQNVTGVGTFLVALKRKIAQLYEELTGRPEDEIWLTTQSVVHYGKRKPADPK